jgi:hypothetical protein
VLLSRGGERPAGPGPGLLALGCGYREIMDLTGWTYTKVNRCSAEGRERLRESGWRSTSAADRPWIRDGGVRLPAASLTPPGPRAYARAQVGSFAGVQNFPTVGLIDGTFRANLEETGMSYALEVEMIGAAKELGLLTAPYVFDPDSAAAMTGAGADVLVPHMGRPPRG